MVRVILTAFTGLFLVSCLGSPEPREVDLGQRYDFTKDYIWSELTDMVKRKWRVESEDKAAGTIVTRWDSNLHQMNTFGRRHRLTLMLEGQDGEGYSLAAKQETEINTNALDPMSLEEAEWEPTQSDGAFAHQLLMNFHNRITPRESWRTDKER